MRKGVESYTNAPHFFDMRRTSPEFSSGRGEVEDAVTDTEYVALAMYSRSSTMFYYATSPARSILLGRAMVIV